MNEHWGMNRSPGMIEMWTRNCIKHHRYCYELRKLESRLHRKYFQNLSQQCKCWSIISLKGIYVFSTPCNSVKSMGVCPSLCNKYNPNFYLSISIQILFSAFHWTKIFQCSELNIRQQEKGILCLSKSTDSTQMK